MFPRAARPCSCPGAARKPCRRRAEDSFGPDASQVSRARGHEPAVPRHGARRLSLCVLEMAATSLKAPELIMVREGKSKWRTGRETIALTETSHREQRSLLQTE